MKERNKRHLQGFKMDLFLLAQAVGAVAMAGAIFQMQIKNSRHIMLAAIPISSLWILQYILLAAPAGVVSNLVNVFRGAAVLTKGKTIVQCYWGLNLMVVVIAYFICDSLIDTLPFISALIGNLTLLKADDRKFLCRTNLVGCMLWHIYNISVGSWMGLTCGIIVMCSTLIGMARYEGWFKPTQPVMQAAE